MTIIRPIASVTERDIERDTRLQRSEDGSGRAHELTSSRTRTPHTRITTIDRLHIHRVNGMIQTHMGSTSIFRTTHE